MGRLFQSESDGSVSFAVLVQPGASRDQVVGRHGDAVKIRVGAPPEGGRANKAVCAVVAKEFGVRPGAVAVVSGMTSRNKRVRVEDAEPAAVRDALARMGLDG